MFSAGSSNALAKGAVIQDEAEFYIALSFSLASSVSTQISALRYQLFESSLKPGFMYCRYFLLLRPR